MDSNTTPGAGASDPVLPQSEEAGEPTPTLTDPAQDPNGTPAPAASDKHRLKHIRPKRSGKYGTKFWKGRIKTELQEKKKKEYSEEGLWDPDTYLHTEKDRINFFSGHRVRSNFPRDRMKFARYAIETALRDYPPGIHGGLEESRSAVSKIEAANKSKEILQVVKAEGQREIDAEVR